jgi:hypothetical protein
VPFFDVLSLKNDENVPSNRKKAEKLRKKVFCWHLEGQ